MTEYGVDPDGVGTVASKTVRATCLEDALRLAAGDEASAATAGNAATEPPVIAGGGKGDGQRARLQIVRAAAADKKR